jgi:hypothetical protein
VLVVDEEVLNGHLFLDYLDLEEGVAGRPTGVVLNRN